MSETSSETLSYHARVTKPRRKTILSLIFKETPDADDALRKVLSIRPSLLFPAPSTRKPCTQPRPRNSPSAVLRIALAADADD